MSEPPHQRLGPIGWMTAAFRADPMRVIAWTAALLLIGGSAVGALVNFVIVPNQLRQAELLWVKPVFEPPDAPSDSN